MGSNGSIDLSNFLFFKISYLCKQKFYHSAPPMALEVLIVASFIFSTMNLKKKRKGYIGKLHNSQLRCTTQIGASQVINIKYNMATNTSRASNYKISDWCWRSRKCCQLKKLLLRPAHQVVWGPAQGLGLRPT